MPPSSVRLSEITLYIGMPRGEIPRGLFLLTVSTIWERARNKTPRHPPRLSATRAVLHEKSVQPQLPMMVAHGFLTAHTRNRSAPRSGLKPGRRAQRTHRCKATATRMAAGTMQRTRQPTHNENMYTSKPWKQELPQANEPYNSNPGTSVRQQN